MPKLDLIRENLFLGDFCAAAEILKNGSSEISHVLTVLHCPSLSTFEEWRNVKLDSKQTKEVYVGDEESLQGRVFGTESALPSGSLLYSLEHTGKDLKTTRMGVFAHDKEWENLLDYFDLCSDFIDDGRRDKGVLVHCFAGQSRSASIVIAYLMKTEKLTREDALASLKQSSNDVSPNPGFLKQLDLFERMNFKVDRSSSIYKHFRLKALGYIYGKDKKFDRLKLRADPGTSNGSSSSSSYQCKKCRRVVLFQEQVIEHSPGEADSEFDDMFKNMIGEVHNKNPGGETKCTSVFVEPLSWMIAVEDDDDVSEGKLMCPECKARLGSFDWSGSYCSCGSKIVPAFQLQMSRVDVVKVDVSKKTKKKHDKKRA